MINTFSALSFFCLNEFAVNQNKHYYKSYLNRLNKIADDPLLLSEPGVIRRDAVLFKKRKQKNKRVLEQNERNQKRLKQIQTRRPQRSSHNIKIQNIKGKYQQTLSVKKGNKMMNSALQRIENRVPQIFTYAPILESKYRYNKETFNSIPRKRLHKL